MHLEPRYEAEDPAVTCARLLVERGWLGWNADQVPEMGGLIRDIVGKADQVAGKRMRVIEVWSKHGRFILLAEPLEDFNHRMAGKRVLRDNGMVAS